MSSSEIVHVPDKKDVRAICELIAKQYISVGRKIQEYLKAKSEDPTKFNAQPYMESQRDYVWEKTRASNLIQTLLMFEGAIPEMIVYRDDSRSNYRRVLDGQQRLTSIFLFLNNEFPLDMTKSLYPVFTIEGIKHASTEMHGKTFAELPELWRDIINGRTLRWICINNCDEATAERLFVQYNSSGKGLKPTEIRKAGMGGKVRKFLVEAKSADWVLHAMTPLAIAGNQGDDIFTQMITLLDNGMIATSLASAAVDNAIYKYRDTGLSQNLTDSVDEVNEYLNSVSSIWVEKKKTDDATRTKGKKVKNYNSCRFKFFNKTNTVMIMAAAFWASRAEVSHELFSKWAADFFTNPPLEYKKASGSGSDNKPSDEDNVQLRLAIIRAAINTMQPVEMKQKDEEANATSPFVLQYSKNDFSEFEDVEEEDEGTDADHAA